MASSEFTVGLESSRNSSKVLKPPGGGSSDIFGIGSSNVATANSNVRSNPQRNVSNIFTGETQTSVSRKKQYAHRNPITGEGFEVTDNEKSAVNEKENGDKIENNEIENKAAHTESGEPAKTIQTSIRVRNPPGGKSSGIF